MELIHVILEKDKESAPIYYYFKGGRRMGVLLAYIFPFSIVLFVLFFLVKAAVKSAIDDEKHENKKNNNRSEINKEDFSELIKLRDIELLSDAELEEVIELYQAERVKKEGYEQYLKSLAIFNELKEREYFNNEQYADKINGLKKYYDMD